MEWVTRDSSKSEDRRTKILTTSWNFPTKVKKQVKENISF